MKVSNGYKVSIIVPTFNRAVLLRKTIQSVIDQSYTNWELLIIDDGSEDDTENMVRSFRDERIQFIRRNEQPTGASVCRNIGIKASVGGYIMFLDSDDLLSDFCLESRVNCFEEFPELDFLVFPSAFCNSKISDALVLWNRFDERDDLKRFLSSDVVWHTSGSFFKRESLIKNDLKYHEDARSGQDWFFHLDVLLKDLSYTKIETIPDVFIRRDASQKRISDEHGDTDKAYNRIELMKDLFTRKEISSDKEKTELLLKTVFREFFALLNTKRTIPNTTLEYFSLIAKNNDKLEKILKQIMVCNFLVGKEFLFYRMYKKFFFPKWIDGELNNRSKYRSNMTTQEIEEFKQLFLINKKTIS